MRGRGGVPVRAQHVPADRAPHRGRHVPHGAVSRRAPARVLLRGLARARRPARTRARRVGDDRHRAAGGRGASDGDRADQAAPGSRPHDAPRGHALSLGRRRDRDRRLGQRAAPGRARQQRAHQRVQGGDVRHPARAAAPRTGPAGVRRGLPPPRGGGRREARDARLAGVLRRARQAADGLLHRHLGVHRLQGVRGRVQGVEPDPDVDPRIHREVLRQHGRARRRHLAPRRVHRAAGSRRRHRRRVAPRRGRARSGDRRRRPDVPGRRRIQVADGLRRVQALHGRGVPRGVPDRRAVPDRVRDGRRPAGRLQRLRLLRPRVPVRRDRPARG